MLHEILLPTAFLAGVLTFFSPCSIALLPTYISYYLGRPEEATSAARASEVSKTGLLRAIYLALFGGVLLTVGFVRPFIEVLGANFTYGPADFAAIGIGTVILVAFAYRAGQYLLAVPPHELAELRSGVWRGVGFGLATAAGFFSFILFVGALVILGSTAIADVLPPVAFGMAAFLVVIGVLMVADVNVSFIPRFIAPKGRGFLSFYTFGVGYATISAGCLLPVFGAILVNVVTAMSLGHVVLAAGILGAYGLGMAVLMVVFSTYVAIAKQTSIQYLRKIMPVVKKVSGGIVIAMGAFIMWYAWTFFLAA